MLSSRVNEVFTQLVHVFIFAEQEENKTIRCTHCANLNTLVARSITVEIWQTFFVPLEQVPYVPSHSPYGCLPQGVVVLFGSLTSSTLSGKSCDSTCESFWCMFLSLDVRLNIHVARSVGLTLFVTVALLCLRPYYRLGRNLSHPPRKCVRWTPNPWS